jgi:ribosomal protein L29
MRQIHAAIEHMERGDFECAITPAEAANGTLAEADEFEIRAAGGTEGANDYINWLKHARLILMGQESRWQSSPNVEVIATIRRAIARVLAAYPEVKTPQMLSFENWAQIRFGSQQ